MTGPVVVFGANGQVGWELARRTGTRGWRTVALTREDADITNRAEIDAALAHYRPSLIANAAAYTAVDKAESEPEVAFLVNRDGAANVAAAAASVGAPVIHLSTDYVFDGNKDGAWTEDDPIAPLSVYGASKAAGEAAVRDSCPRHIILRTAWIYGAHGHNFVKTMLRLAGERDELRVVADQLGCPTAAGDIADAILAVGDAVVHDGGQAPWGTYHFCGSGRTTWFGLAEAIVDARANEIGRRPAVHPITTADYPLPAHRPANSVLDCTRLSARFGITAPDWRTSLASVLNELTTET